MGVSWTVQTAGLQSEKIKKFNRRERKFHSLRAGKLRQGEIKGYGSLIVFRILSCLIISFNGIEIISLLRVTKLFSGSRTSVGHFSWEVSRRGAVSQPVLSFNHRLISPAADCHNFALSPSVGFSVSEDLLFQKILPVMSSYWFFWGTINLASTFKINKKILWIINTCLCLYHWNPSWKCSVSYPAPLPPLSFC